MNKSNDDKTNGIFHRLTKDYSDSKKPILPQLNEDEVIPNQQVQEELRMRKRNLMNNVEQTQEEYTTAPKPRKQFAHKKLQPRNFDEVVKPNQLSELEEQLKVIEGDLIYKIEQGVPEAVIRYTYEWIDGIIDEDTKKLYPNLRKSLNELSKNDLIDYIEMLILGSY